MSRHRAEPPRRRAPAPRGRRAATSSQPRYGRIGVLAVSATVCGVALLGGTGVLPSVSEEGPTVARDLSGQNQLAAVGQRAMLVMDSSVADATFEEAGRAGQQDTQQDTQRTGEKDEAEQAQQAQLEASADETLPADSGEGYRVVFSEARQRVWLVGEDGEVERTYPVSGSLYDNLDPGTFEVYSRSEQAYAFDGSGSMKYFVRFTQGDTGAAIGFHDIPLDNDGELVQTVDQLGTPQSHGCIRQEREDAVALWEFAPEGTTVVVV